MKRPILLLNNVHDVIEALKDSVGYGVPKSCNHCGREFDKVASRRYERFDLVYKKVCIGFIECPGCRTEWIYIRKEPMK